MSKGPKSLAQLANATTLPTRGEHYQPHQPAPISDREAEVVGRLLERLKLIFPAWKRAFPTESAERRAGQEWTRALIDADCTSREQLARGMRQARMQSIPFFPSPGQFIEWCEATPESLGLPTLDNALHEVATRRFSHPAVTLAWKASRYASGTMTAAEYRPVFERNYKIMVDRVLNGEDLEAEILKGLPSREQVVHSRDYYIEASKRGLEQLRTLTRGKAFRHTGNE
jgi:hypothetical protein